MPALPAGLAGTSQPPGPQATGPGRAETVTLPSLRAKAAALRSAGRNGEAAATLRRAVEMDPRSSESLHEFGITLEEGGDRDGAIACYERAVALKPRLADAHARLGTLLNLAGRKEQAVAHLRRAASAAPGTTLGRLCRARAFLLEDNLAEAETALRHAAALDPGDAQVSRMLGSVLSIQGRFADAAGHFQRAIQADPAEVTAYLGLVRSRKVTTADLPLLDAMRGCARSAGLPAPQRMTLHFALGKALDDLGDYAGAWGQFEAANRLRGQTARLDRKALITRVDRIIAAFGPTVFEADAPGASLDETPVFILGMPRSGTTLVEQVVSSHPDAADAGELRFWTGCGPAWEGSGSIDAGGLARGYLALLRGLAPDAARVTDKNPFNFLWIGLIRLSFPRAVILHCRRDSIDTCLSIHQTQFAAPLDFASDLGDLAFFYHQYERLMAHWRSVLDPARLVDISYEGLTAGGAPAIRSLVEACGLPWSDVCLRPESNPRPVRTASLWQARQPIYQDAVARWRHYEPWIGTLVADLGLAPAGSV